MGSKFEASLPHRAPRPLHIVLHVIDLLAPAPILYERIAGGHTDFRVEPVA